MTDESTKYLDYIFVRMEAEIREQIAKDIEAFKVTSENALDVQMITAAIARGKND
jgi:hypothetical protein